MWKRRWGYAEGWAICLGLFVIGIGLQVLTGKVNVDVFHYPSNLIFGLLFILIVLTIHISGHWKPFLKWFSGLEASITSLVSLLVLVIIMGLTRQISPTVDISTEGGFVWLGFMQMTVSWSFIFLFLYFLLVLGLVTLRRITHFRWKDMGFVLNHAGLFIALLAAILGSGDLQRLRMTVPVDETEWRATDEKNEMVVLPIAVELHTFTIEEYPPKLLLLDNVTGQPLPDKQPQTLLAEEIPTTGQLLEWEIEVTNFLPYAACFMSPDTVSFLEFHTEGATSAVYVKAKNTKNGTQKEGWVSSGNFMFPYVSLPLDEQVSLIMPEREPRRFASEVTVYSKEKGIKEAVIEVNKPFHIAGWKIYQLSYDEYRGKWSKISVFEIVRDPWLPIVYTGILMMIAGAVYLFISAPKKSE